jgi:protein SCO1/2
MTIPGRAALVLCLVAAATRALPARAGEKQIVFPQGAEQPLAALQDIDVIEHLGERVPTSLGFTDAAGQAQSLESLLHRGKPVLVTLGYHRCPMLCGLVLDGLVKAMKVSGLALGKDVLAVDISIDPTEDLKLTADTQKRVVDLVGRAKDPALLDAASIWPFWVSKADGGTAARALGDAVGFRYKYDETSKLYAHEAVAFVLTPEGAIARYLYGVDYSPRDFRMAVVEAGGGRVGTSFDKVVMSCYRYDPVTRRYGPFVFGFVRIGALLSFFALAGLLTVLWRKEIAMQRERRAAAARIGRTA